MSPVRSEPLHRSRALVSSRSSSHARRRRSLHHLRSSAAVESTRVTRSSTSRSASRRTVRTRVRRRVRSEAQAMRGRAANRRSCLLSAVEQHAPSLLGRAMDDRQQRERADELEHSGREQAMPCESVPSSAAHPPPPSQARACMGSHRPVHAHVIVGRRRGRFCACRRRLWSTVDEARLSGR
jgi:hypothetical protein